MVKMLLSFIIPTFNSEKTIGQCLSSIPKQKDIEVIVIDNFSSDATLKICKKYGAKVYQVKSTRGKARNYGVELSSGKYVMRLDSDEMISQKMLIELMTKLKKSKPDLVLVPRIELGYWRRVREIINEHDGQYFYHKPYRNLFPMVFKRELFEKFRQSETIQYGEDSEQLVRMAPYFKNSIVLGNSIFHLPIELREETSRRALKSGLPSFRRYKKSQANIMFYAHRYFYILKKHPKHLLGAILLLFPSSLGRLMVKLEKE